jgi:hypothetical protein
MYTPHIIRVQPMISGCTCSLYTDNGINCTARNIVFCRTAASSPAAEWKDLLQGAIQALLHSSALLFVATAIQPRQAQSSSSDLMDVVRLLDCGALCLAPPVIYYYGTDLCVNGVSQSLHGYAACVQLHLTLPSVVHQV